MTTDRQIQANRENASKSTGPRTPQGKARSRFNAVKHGAYIVETSCYAGGDEGEELDIVEEVFAALDPQDAFQESLAAEIGNAFLGLHRARRYERTALSDAVRRSAEAFVRTYGKSPQQIDEDIETLRLARSLLELGSNSEFASMYSKEWGVVALRYVAELLNNANAGRRLTAVETRPAPAWVTSSPTIEGFVEQLVLAFGGSRDRAIEFMSQLTLVTQVMNARDLGSIEEAAAAQSLNILASTADARERMVRTLDRLTRLFEKRVASTSLDEG